MCWSRPSRGSRSQWRNRPFRCAVSSTAFSSAIHLLNFSGGRLISSQCVSISHLRTIWISAGVPSACAFSIANIASHGRGSSAWTGRLTVSSASRGAREQRSTWSSDRSGMLRVGRQGRLPMLRIRPSLCRPSSIALGPEARLGLPDVGLQAVRCVLDGVALGPTMGSAQSCWTGQ